MRWKRWAALKLTLVTYAALSIAAPAVIAQTPSSTIPAGVQVQKSTTVNTQGNTLVTERTFVNGRLVKEEVTVTNGVGQVISKAETTFNVAGQIAKRETVTVSGGVITQVEQRFVNGQLVKQEIQTVAINNGQLVKVEREFQVINGVLKEVKEERKLEKVEREVKVEREIKKVENDAPKGGGSGRREASGTGGDRDGMGGGDHGGDHGGGSHEH